MFEEFFDDDDYDPDWDALDGWFDDDIGQEGDYDPDFDWLTVCSVCGDRECDSRGDGICHVCKTQMWIDDNA